MLLQRSTIPLHAVIKSSNALPAFDNFACGRLRSIGYLPQIDSIQHPFRINEFIVTL
jgi:hypothetical protein